LSQVLDGYHAAMDPHAFVDALVADPGRAEAITAVRVRPARRPEVVPFPHAIPDLLMDRLALQGIAGLWPHQRQGLESLMAGRNTIVATGTASGKTLVYNLAFATSALEDRRSTALYLFPTKALARDQLRQVRALKLPQIRASVYDGDTPQAERTLIRRNANLVMTNPDMLHLLLSDHARWADFLFRLSLVVVDEAHTARGVFGSHIAMVLRRLRRLVARYGGDPRFAMASATVGNPAELAERLTGLPFDEVGEDTSPAGEKRFVLWNPPVIDELSGARRSPLTEGSRLVAELVEAGVRTIAFARSRRAAELLADFSRRDLPAGLKGRVKAYRAGYLPEERRELERMLSDGELLAIASTTALELGIDIGSLDAAVLVGYPGTRASFWQQAGRAGRTTGGSLAILIAQDDPLDQYLVTHPEDLFDRPPEASVVDPTNPFVLEPHLACAAREMPIRDDELAFFGPAEVAAAAIGRLEERGEVVRRKDSWHVRPSAPAHSDLDIRGAGGATVSIVMTDTGELLGTVDEARAHVQVHPGAIYLHQGEQFEVETLDLDGRAALVTRSDADFYTQPRDLTDIRVTDVMGEATCGETPCSFGTVLVTRQVVGFVRRSHRSGEIVDSEPLDLPAQVLETKAVWWSIPLAIIGRAALTPPQIPGAAHAAEHAAIGLLPLIATCDRWDIGGVSTAHHLDTDAATIFIYDGYPGGAGIAERGFRASERLLRATLDTIRNCGCSEGCPSCVVSPKCGNGNEPLDKAGAASLLAAMLGDAWG
jgi:DEAD/DEAH box helicase domain-containing protein